MLRLHILPTTNYFWLDMTKIYIQNLTIHHEHTFKFISKKGDSKIKIYNMGYWKWIHEIYKLRKKFHTHFHPILLRAKTKRPSCSQLLSWMCRRWPFQAFKSMWSSKVRFLGWKFWFGTKQRRKRTHTWNYNCVPPITRKVGHKSHMGF